MSATSAPVPEPEPYLPPVTTVLLTRSEYEAREEELRRLHAARDRDLPGRLRDARTLVSADAQEEIGQIQVEQHVLDARIAKLEELLVTAKVVDDDVAEGVVTVGTTVEAVYESTGRRMTFHITGTGTDGTPGAVSARSPVGSALVGHRAGDVVTALLPDGREERLTILAVRRGDVG